MQGTRVMSRDCNVISVAMLYLDLPDDFLAFSTFYGRLQLIKECRRSLLFAHADVFEVGSMYVKPLMC